MEAPRVPHFKKIQDTKFSEQPVVNRVGGTEKNKHTSEQDLGCKASFPKGRVPPAQNSNDKHFEGSVSDTESEKYTHA